MKKFAASLFLLTLSFTFIFGSPIPPLPNLGGGEAMVDLIDEMEEAGFVLDFQDGFDEDWEIDQWLEIGEIDDFDFPGDAAFEGNEGNLMNEVEFDDELDEIDNLEFIECLELILEGKIEEDLADEYCEHFHDELFKAFGVESVDDLLDDHEVNDLESPLSLENLEEKWQKKHIEALVDEVDEEIDGDLEVEDIELEE